MAWFAILVSTASIHFVASGPASSVLYDAATHVPRASSGCGKSSPYRQGKTSVATGTYAGVKWTWRVYVPYAYNQYTPMPLILQHPGWGMTAKSEESGAGITSWAESKGFISVTPQGADDNPTPGSWYSWNAVGTTQSPGPAGATCTSAANAPSYCYSSCAPCRDSPQCDWTTCDETVTPTGTGRSKVGGFIPGLYDTLEAQLCIDTTREYAAGESNGGMMTYQLGVDLGSRLAAIAPQFGSFHRGFAMAPEVGVPVLDIHGTRDTTVPANVSLSGDGYYYTVTAQIFGGSQYSTGWKKANGCQGSVSHYPTNYDGIQRLWCGVEGSCSGGDVVFCSYAGGHTWFNNGGPDNGGLVTDFLLRWKKPSHIGGGYSEGDELAPGDMLEDVKVLGANLGGDDPTAGSVPQWPKTLNPGASRQPSDGQVHYGNPAHGCLEDEDILLLGTGRACAPRIGSEPPELGDDRLPVPRCKLGGIAASANGCPVDADVAQSMAWPICLAKSNATDPYRRGDFHCLLVCPCNLGNVSGGECGSESHAHCPTGARCERGELRKMDQGVCTYALQSSPSPSELVV